jgi:glyoxylase-like metal-dependent hydrolase (beta-lactamase superfamily II)
VHEAGLPYLWEDSHRIDSHLRLDLAPGHTPGSSVLRLESGSDRALFAGDLMHSPIRIYEPDANSCFCEDPAEVVREGDKFASKGWAPFSKYTERT